MSVPGLLCHESWTDLSCNNTYVLILEYRQDFKVHEASRMRWMQFGGGTKQIAVLGRQSGAVQTFPLLCFHMPILLVAPENCGGLLSGR